MKSQLMGRGGSLAVRVLDLKTDNPNSNPANVHSFDKMLFDNIERKLKTAKE